MREGRNGGQVRGRSKAEEILSERKWLMILGMADSGKFWWVERKQVGNPDRMTSMFKGELSPPQG